MMIKTDLLYSPTFLMLVEKILIDFASDVLEKQLDRFIHQEIKNVGGKHSKIVVFVCVRNK